MRAALLTYEDLERFPEDGLRRELIGGELFVSPSPIPRHQWVAGELIAILREHAKRNGGLAFGGPIDVIFGRSDVTAPDAIYVAPERLGQISERGIEGPPSLIVEVLSPSNRRVDLGRKRELYARFEVPEYWIADPKRATIERCNNPANGRYTRIEIFNSGTMPSATIARLEVTISEVFAWPLSC